jgi:D-arginine dehydrogenase
MDSEVFDVAIVGAGMAGASLAYFLAQPGAGAPLRVLLLEREAQPGFHSTGRSAAMFEESYGPPAVRALTRAGRGFFELPPRGFGEGPLITPRGALFIAAADRLAPLQQLQATLQAEGVAAQMLATAEARALCPVLRPEAVAAAVLDPGAADLDVHRLHQGFLRGARAGGVQLVCSAGVQALEHAPAGWRLDTTAGRFVAQQVVNAAGAWADELGALAGLAPIQLQPKRRSAFVFDPPADLPTRDWPLVTDIDESFYFKPEGALLLGSPANTDPVPPHDVMPEEIDIATGIHRIEAATTLQIRRPRRSWAGLRSFVPDGELVIGAEPTSETFFWLAAQGGYGIQTSVGAGRLAAALLRRRSLPDWADAPLLRALSPRRGALP